MRRSTEGGLQTARMRSSADRLTAGIWSKRPAGDMGTRPAVWRLTLETRRGTGCPLSISLKHCDSCKRSAVRAAWSPARQREQRTLTLRRY